LRPFAPASPQERHPAAWRRSCPARPSPFSEASYSAVTVAITPFVGRVLTDDLLDEVKAAICAVPGIDRVIPDAPGDGAIAVQFGSNSETIAATIIPER